MPAVSTSRRELLAWLAAAALPAAATGAPSRFDFDLLAAHAQALAQQPPRPPLQAPPALRALSYDQARDIRFRPERALWRDLGLPFEAQFFHLGHLQTQAVRLHEWLPDGTVRALAYDPSAFDSGHTHLDPMLVRAPGYAGFRLHHALNGPAYKDELVVFQGASYFRALGAGQRYGLSARALAIDTAGGSGEEFPRLTEFWLQRPAPGADRIVVLALLESARVTGACRFEIVPGGQTVTTVRLRLFLRPGAPPVATLGLAPLTSMFLHGEGQPRGDDFRPEVHDSDGLLLADGSGEWLWRPLQNPARTLVSAFTLRAPRGFGLMQRDRRFASYEDTEARYELRPSAWVEPVGDWGQGRVELLQFPTPDETHDNVVACWVPAQLPAPGQALEIAWRVHWQGDAMTTPPGGWSVQTRSGRSHAALARNERQFIVDFQGPALAALPANAAVHAIATADAHGEVLEAIAWRNDPGRAWRLALRVRLRDPAQPVELRAFLQHQTHTLTETWTHIVLPR